MIKLSDYVFEYIANVGVKDVFMLSGGGCMHLVDSLGRNSRLSYKCCLFEQVVALAADAYAQYTNNLGVGLVTTGPGGTNAITGVAAAWTDSIPLLMISGQVKTQDLSQGTVRTKGFQELDIVSVVKPITKYATTVLNPHDIKKELDKALFFCKNGRPGPVWLDIPLDVQAAIIDESKLEGYIPEMEEDKNISDEIDKIIKCFQHAERPIILAGYGIKTSGAEEIFHKVINILQVPVLTTWKAMDLLPEDHPLFVGRPGCIGQRAANFAQQNSDLIMTLGARLDFGQIGYASETFAREAVKIINDVDEAELKKFSFNIDVPICVDTRYFLLKLLEKLESYSGKNVQDWFLQCQKWKKKYPVVLEQFYQYSNGVSTYVLMEKISQYTDQDTVFAPGNSGACSEIFSQAYKVKKGQRIVSTNTLGSMGTGLPESIGACIASEMKTTICVNGDGGIQMNIQDLETIRRCHLPIKIFVLNNDGYGSIRNSQNNYFEGYYVGAEEGSGVTLPVFSKIADTYDFRYYLAKDNKMLDDIIPSMLGYDGPAMCEIMVSPDEVTMPKQSSYVREDGTMVSRPLEDLAPFLDRDTLKKEMIISLVNE